jgi:hypothetical protein
MERTPSQDRNADRLRQTDLPLGLYDITLGFPQTNSTDARYYYGNRPQETHSEPIILDVQSDAFRQLTVRYKNDAQNTSSLSEQIEVLKRMMERSFQSTAADQHIRKASEIIAQKSGACDSLVLIAGLVLDQSKLLRGASIERILGASNPFGDTRPHDVNHAWLRISDGKTAVLKVLRSYDLQSPELQLDASDPFYSYEVYALGAPNLSRVPGIRDLRGQARFVKRVDGGNELWLTRPHALVSQVTGEVDYSFRSDGTQLRTVNDAIEVVATAGTNAPRFLIPVRDIVKKSE